MEKKNNLTYVLCKTSKKDQINWKNCTFLKESNNIFIKDNFDDMCVQNLSFNLYLYNTI